ncbi:DUF899 family protein [Spongiactinospora sp. TRM90649]|uniref:DUF899 family protein n=1 Tax=Spongiactinospora sp. TRM90649 TaxID=3031114 RepID=UPI0023F72221|nr:DUF899 family protein [Spongiactinospora sp. TRM90649]MDF5757353.1 DUF899 family protein [Spongiactinospora sp. TRM90649]
MVQVDKPYTFEGPDGEMSLLDLFEGRSQLLIYTSSRTSLSGSAAASCPTAQSRRTRRDGPASPVYGQRARPPSPPFWRSARRATRAASPSRFTANCCSRTSMRHPCPTSET